MPPLGRFVGVLAFAGLLAGSPFAWSQNYNSGNPTPHEQFMLELINRARANPSAEASRFGMGLNDGLPANTISSSPKPPLTMNRHLLSAARGHTSYLLSSGNLSHTGSGGSTPGQRMGSAGYNFTGAWFWSENIAYTSMVLKGGTARCHEILFKSTSGHRQNLLGTQAREIGIGIQEGAFRGNSPTTFTTQDFATTASSPEPFLLGVVYEDKNGNNFYNVGEGLSGVSITVSGIGASAETGTAGGFAIPVPPNAKYTLTFTVPGRGTFTREITVANANAKVDLILGSATVDLSGEPEIFWQNSNSGKIAGWTLDDQRTTATGGAFNEQPPGPNLQLVGQGDFNGNGKLDLVFQNQKTGVIQVWFMDRFTRQEVAFVEASRNWGHVRWRVSAVADFNGDAQPDLVLQNRNTGRIVIWTMRSAAFSGTIVPDFQPQSASMRVAAAADMNGNGKPALLMQNRSSGRVNVWSLEGNHVADRSPLQVQAGSSAWLLVGAQDIDLDSKVDLLWQNRNTGRVLFWWMDGVDFAGSATLLPARNPVWQIKNSRAILRK